MPHALGKPCRHPGCPELTHERFCAVHQREAYRAQDAKRPFRLYGDPVWRAVRERVLAMRPNCERCGARARVVNHRVPVAAGGAYLDVTNLESLCKACHDAHTATSDMARDANGRWTGRRGGFDGPLGGAA